MATHLTQIAAEDHLAQLRADARRWQAVRDAHEALLKKTSASRRASRAKRLARRRRAAAAA